MDHESLVLTLAFLGSLMLHALGRSRAMSMSIPAIAVFFVLGYLESRRPYAGGGASFYIFVQIELAIFTIFLSAMAVLIVEKISPRNN